MILDDEAPATLKLSWLDYNECVERYGVNPIGRSDIRNKLDRRDGKLVRVWLEDDVKGAQK